MGGHSSSDSPTIVPVKVPGTKYNPVDSLINNGKKASDALNPNVSSNSGNGYQLPDWAKPGKTGTGGQTITHQADGTDLNPVIQKFAPGPGSDAYSGGGNAFSKGGWPDYPDLHSTVNYDKSGNPILKNGLSFDPTHVAGAPVDSQALDALQKRALSKDGSAWLGMMNNRADAMGAGYKDAAALDTQTAMTGAMDSAAVRGGLSGGGSARIAGRSAVAGVNAQQGANKWLADAKLGNNIEDERQKLEIEKALPGMQLDKAKYGTGVEEFNATADNFGKAKNIDTITGGVGADNAGKVAMYGDTIQKLIGDNLGSAMSKSGKK